MLQHVGKALDAAATTEIGKSYIEIDLPCLLYTSRCV